MSSHLRAAFLFVLAFSPSVASAQSSTGELRDEETLHRVWADLGFYYRTLDMTEIGMFQPSVYGNFTVIDGDAVDLQLDFAWRFVGLFGETSAFRAMNPYFGARVAFGETMDDGSRWRARAGAGFTLPLTNAYDDFRAGASGAGPIAMLLGVPMQGVYDAWLGLPLTSSVVLRGDFEYRAEYFVVGVDTALALNFPVEYDGRTGDTSIALQIGGYAGGRPIPELVLGARLQAVALTTTADTMGRSNTEGYTSLMPFVRGELGPAFVEGRLVMNLDDPYGWSFDSGGGFASLFHVWSLQVSGGASF